MYASSSFLLLHSTIHAHSRGRYIQVACGSYIALPPKCTSTLTENLELLPNPTVLAHSCLLGQRPDHPHPPPPEHRHHPWKRSAERRGWKRTEAGKWATALEVSSGFKLQRQDVGNGCLASRVIGPWAGDLKGSRGTWCANDCRAVCVIGAQP